MNKPTRIILLFCSIAMLNACGKAPTDAVNQKSDSFEDQVAEYIQKFPYQDTFGYAMLSTGGDPSKLNTWVLGGAALVRAGDDVVVRMNNDTYYEMAILDLKNGSVVLGSSAPAKDRFNSFQLMDDRNANYRNVIHPKGEYTLYFGEKPMQILGEAIEVPSSLSVVIVRVEVKDKDDPDDVAAAKSVFNGITIMGEQPAEFPSLDLLSGYPADVADEANRRMDEAMATIPFTDTIVGPGQEPGRDVPVLNHSAGTKGGWGGPDPAHSAYETIFFDKNGDVTTLAFRISQRNKDRWNYLLGFNWDMNKRWSIMAEAGFGGSRENFIGGVTYRF